MFDLAPGVDFDEDKHIYTYKGKLLSGVTTPIGKFYAKTFKNAPVEQEKQEGSYVHKVVSDWISGKDVVTSIAGAIWTISEIKKIVDINGGMLYSEVLVSDFNKYASSIDIIHVLPDGRFDLYDIKRTMYRPTVTAQLTMYKNLVEQRGYAVNNLYCIGFLDKQVYPVIPASGKIIDAIFYS